MARTLKTHEIRVAHASLAAIEALHTNSLQSGPAAIDHTPYEKYHNEDQPGSCPVCEALGHVKAVRAILNGESA